MTAYAIKRPSANMMNTRKVLMILGGLLVGAAGASYLMLLEADHLATAEARAGIDESLQTPAIDSPVSGNQVTQGSIDSSQASGAITKGASVAQQPAAQKPARSGPSVLASAQPSDDTDADASDEPQQGARSAPNSASARADRSGTGRATRHAHRAKPKETLVSRLTAMFRKVVYHRRSNEPGNNPDPHSHP